MRWSRRFACWPASASVHDMTDHVVSLTASGPPETVLPEAPAAQRHALAQAIAIADPDERRTALAAVVAGDPAWPDA